MWIYFSVIKLVLCCKYSFELPQAWPVKLGQVLPSEALQSLLFPFTQAPHLLFPRGGHLFPGCVHGSLGGPEFNFDHI